jgi:hypothetical protein
MMDNRHDYGRADDVADQPPVPAQLELEAEFDADDIAVAAGQVIPMEPVLNRMRATAERIRRERVLGLEKPHSE